MRSTIQTTLKNLSLTLALSALGLSAAHAHVTLEQQTAPAGSNYRAVFRVGHGCDGSATTRITVFLPAGFVGTKPMPKPGWALSTRSETSEATPAAHEHGHDHAHGAEAAEAAPAGRVSEVSWSGGKLLDSEYDEFILRTTLPAQAGKQYIRVLQTCERGENDWAVIPDGNGSGGKTAAQLLLTPADAAPAHQH